MKNKEMKGTKLQIFTAAVELFAEYSYDAVAIKDITNKIVIKPASLYNHFDSKISILHEAYRYYERNALALYKDVDYYLKLCETEHPYNVLKELLLLHYTQETDYLMERIMIILLANMYSDPLARDLVANRFKDNIYRYLSEIFHKLTDLGKIVPVDLDIFVFKLTSIHYYTITQQYLNKDNKEKRDELGKLWYNSILDLIMDIQVIE